MEAAAVGQEEILININSFETRVALLRDGSLQEVHIERSEGYSYTGNIYKGRVARILPGMQAAFVDIGLERPGFLHARDIHGLANDPQAGGDISRVLHEGQSLLVQVVKDPISTKGARVTTELSLASRFLVMMPLVDNVGISQRIEDECERERLKSLVISQRSEIAADCGWIVRTVADGAGAEPLRQDMEFLAHVWDLLSHSHQYADAPALIYEELPLHIRTVRDLVHANVAAIHIDSEATFSRVSAFIERFLPAFRDRLIAHRDEVPLFERYGIEDEIDRALGTRVDLKSGGHLVIEQTEAMTTVDVNTGSFAGGRNLEETIYRTNLEAAAAIPRQLRLRNLGGIIVIDFIDMDDQEHQRQVLRALEKACDSDPTRIRISGLSGLGLVEMSRKRTRDSLARQLCAPCGHCDGVGAIKTAETMCFEIFRAILRDARRRAAVPRTRSHALIAAEANGFDTEGGQEYLVRASQAVIDRLLDEDAENIMAVGEEAGTEIRLQVEPSYRNEQFDIVLMQGLT